MASLFGRREDPKNPEELAVSAFAESPTLDNFKSVCAYPIKLTEPSEPSLKLQAYVIVAATLISPVMTERKTETEEGLPKIQDVLKRYLIEEAAEIIRQKISSRTLEKAPRTHGGASSGMPYSVRR